MADSKITALTALTAADPVNDMFPIVDVSDTTMAASGTTKKISVNNILGASGTATLASATITGDLTVRTNGLIVNTTGVGVNITPIVRLHASDSDNPANGTLRLGSASIYGQIKNSASSTGKLEFTSVGTGVNGGYNFSIEGQNAHRIEASGVFNWYDGAGGTRMTLNSTGLNAAGKLAINGASLTYGFNARASSSNLGNTAFIFEQLNGTAILTGRDNGTVIVAGDIRVGNTVNTVSPTSPNRTITMIVNGVTLYIAAKTTND